MLGMDEVKDLIEGDWKYWGDVKIDYENANISSLGDVAWISTNGSVKHDFEDTKERYDNYVNFIKKKAEENGLTPKQRIANINWVLALTYHQRQQGKREYLWPLSLSGVLLKDKETWKFVHMQFSIPKSNFPDERFESSEEYKDNYNKQKNIVNEYKYNQMTPEIKTFLKEFEGEILGSEAPNKEVLEKYFSNIEMPYVIGPESQWYYGNEEISRFFTESDPLNINLDIDHAIAHKAGEVTWVIANGVLSQRISEDELIKRALDETEELIASNLTSEEKLFAIKRSVSYALKESSIGSNYTCPIRMTAVILDTKEGLAFNSIHWSFPFCWIFEGKLDSV